MIQQNLRRKRTVRAQTRLWALIAVGVVLALAAPSWAAPTTLTLQNGTGGYSGIEDTYIDWWGQTTNQASSQTLYTYGAGMRKVLIKVNLPSTLSKNTSILSARLYLRASQGGNDALMYLHDINKPWVSSQATWNNYASGLPWASPGLKNGADYGATYNSAGSIKSSDWSSWDVLSLLQETVHSGGTSISVVLINRSEGINADGIGFYSSESPSTTLRPKLVVTYEPSAPYADAGPDQTVTNWTLGNRIYLNGSASSDPSTSLGSLRFSWSFVEKPGDATRTGPAFSTNNTTGSSGGDKPSFVPDLYGTYVVKLTVTNSAGVSNSDCVTVRVVALTSAHPRIFLTPDRIAKLKGFVAANTYEWQRTYNYARGSAWDAQKQFIKAKGLVYQLKAVSDYTSYGNTVVSQVMSKVSSSVHDPLASTYAVEVVAYGYDWAYDLFTSTQRQQVINWLNDEANYLKSNYWGTSSWSNYFVRGMYAIGLAGYATLGENPQAQSHIDDAWNRWLIVKKGFDLSGVGGGWAEGTGYDGWQTVNLIEYAQLVLTATGEDIYDTTPFFRDRLRYSLFSYHPGFIMTGYSSNYPPYARQTVLIGDGRRGVYGNTVERRIGDQMLIDRYYGKDIAAQELLWFLTRTPADHMPYDEYMVDEFIYFDGSRTRTQPSTLAHWAPGVGEAYFRSDWDPAEKATWISFKSGGQFEGHQHLDANSFTIWKQGDLAIDSGEMDDDIGANWSINWDRRAIAHNTMLIYNPSETFKGFYQMREGKNDGGQRTMDPTSFSSSADLWMAYPYLYDKARTTRFEDNSVFSYVMGDATNAYNSDPNKLNTYGMRGYTTPGNTPKVHNFTRQLVYLRPTSPGGDDFLVVFDRVSSTDASYRKKWLLHSLTAPTVNGTETRIDDHEFTYNGDTFQVDAGKTGTSGDGDGRLFGKVLLPASRLIRKIGGRPKVLSIVRASTNTSNGRLNKVEIGACNTPQTWTMTFTSPTTYTLTGSVSGACGGGSISSEVWSTNGYEIYFRSDCFTGPFNTGDKFTFTIDQGKDFWVFGSNNSPTGGFEPKYGEWRIEVEPTVAAKDDVFLHVLFPTVNTRTSMPTATLVEASTGNMSGAQVGNRVVMFARTEKILNEPITYTVSGSGTSRQILVDMAPDTNFTVSVAGQNSQVRSSSMGVLSFDANLNGATRIDINGGGSTPPPPPPGNPLISLNKVADKTSAKPGEVITYTITYTNTGQSDAINVVISDNLPANTEYVAGSARKNGVTVTPDPVTSGVLRITIGTVQPAGTGNVSFQVKVK